MAWIGKLVPWLLPMGVAVLLGVSLWEREQQKGDTLMDRFERVYLGMDRQRVDEVLGPTRYTVLEFTKAWDFEDAMMVIEFDDRNQMIGKRLQRLSPGPG